eukprot:1150964-Pelagomonas_calceolata.AAC.10
MEAKAEYQCCISIDPPIHAHELHQHSRLTLLAACVLKEGAGVEAAAGEEGVARPLPPRLRALCLPALPGVPPPARVHAEHASGNAGVSALRCMSVLVSHLA